MSNGFTPAQVFATVLIGMGFNDGNGKWVKVGGDPGPQDNHLGMLVMQAYSQQANEAAAMVQISMGWGFHAQLLWLDNAGEVSHNRVHTSIDSLLQDEMLGWTFREHALSHEAAMDMLDTEVTDGWQGRAVADALAEVFTVA
jgi:hypothetical protein